MFSHELELSHNFQNSNFAAHKKAFNLIKFFFYIFLTHFSSAKATLIQIKNLFVFFCFRYTQ